MMDDVSDKNHVARLRWGT